MEDQAPGPTGQTSPNDVPRDPPPPTRDKRDAPRVGRTNTDDHSKGKQRLLMQPQPLADMHPFSKTLHEWQQGIQVDCVPNWTWEACKAAVDSGPHPPASTPESIKLFIDDIGYQEKAGFCKVVTWEEIQHTRPPKLKISPVAVVPQTDRRGRIILDLSFPVYQEIDGVIEIIQASVNEITIISAPTTPVKEIGKVLNRLLHYMKTTVAGVWIYFSKLDISDGFWRMVVTPEDGYNFAYVLPQPPGMPIKIVVPSALQMG